MPLYDTPDGRYTVAWETPGQGDGNSVIYDNWIVPGQKTPVWNRWEYEAGLGAVQPPVVLPPSLPTVPVPVPESPPPEPGPTNWPRQVKVIPVTDPSDGEFAPRMMSDRANAWIQDGTAYVFAGSRNTGGPQFFGVNLASEHVTRFGTLLLPYAGETEFWYWLPDGSLMVAEGTRLHRHKSVTGGGDDVVMDASAATPNAYMIDQWHSSDDGTTHSATVKNAAYQKIGTVTSFRGKLEYWPTIGVLDESQVSRSGRHVVIKEDRGSGDDNRIINLATRETRWLTDQNRAIGHSDCGPDFLVGEADKPDPGACVIWYLDRLNEAPRILFLTTNMGYVSVRGGRCLHSGDTHLSLVALDGSGLTPLIDHGVRAGINYDLRVKANLDPTGRVATYMVNGQVKLLVLPA